MTTRATRLLGAAIAGGLVCCVFLAGGTASALGSPRQVGVASAPAFTQVPSAEGDDQFFWSIRPATVRGVPQTSFFFAGDPGGELKNTVVLQNLGARPISLRIYATDAFTTDAGTTDLLAADKTPRDLGSWISVERSEVALAPQQTAEIGFTVRVPGDAEPGDHTAGIVTSILDEAPKLDEQGVVVDRRLASRVAFRVTGPLNPGLTITDYAASYQGTSNPVGRGSTKLQYRITNDGNVRLGAEQTVKVDGPLGVISKTAKLKNLPELLPGASYVVNTSVPGVWPTVRSKAGIELKPVPTVPGDVFPALSTARASSSSWAMPWAFLIFMFVVMSATAAILKGRQEADRRKKAAVEEAVQARMAERRAAKSQPPGQG